MDADLLADALYSATLPPAANGRATPSDAAIARSRRIVVRFLEELDEAGDGDATARELLELLSGRGG